MVVNVRWGGLREEGTLVNTCLNCFLKEAVSILLASVDLCNGGGKHGARYC